MELEIDKVTQASSLRIIASKMLAVLCAALLLLDTRGAGSPHSKRLPCNHRKTEIPDIEK